MKNWLANILIWILGLGEEPMTVEPMKVKGIK